MRLFAFSAGIGLFVAATISHAATTITFDDLSPGRPGSWLPIPNGYAGLQWSGIGVLDASRDISGYHEAMVSAPNVAFNASRPVSSISNPTGFTLHSAHIVMPGDYGPFLREMHVRVQAMVGTNVAYDITYTIDGTRTLITFDYVGVDRVFFASSPDVPFAMDDLVVTVPPPDASCTYAVVPRSPQHGLGAETGTVEVRTQRGCEWSVSNTNDWITILSALNNSGAATVTYAVNAATSARTGVIKIAGQSVTITQSTPPVDARQTLTFDDLLPGLIPSGYGGLDWINYGVLDGTVQRPESGYHDAVISPDNVAYNQYGDPTIIRGTAPFDLHSAYVTARIFAPSVSSQLRIQGFNGTTLAYDNLYTFTNTQPVLIEFNYLGVTEVRLTPIGHSRWFPIDNVTVTVRSDTDADDDGVPDDQDQCPNTPSGDVVNRNGCSIDQLVPCSGPARGGRWRSHGEYVATVVKVAESLRRAGLITTRERNAIVQTAARSDCGKPMRERPRWPVRRAAQNRQ